jgi:hypothetical protein
MLDTQHLPIRGQVKLVPGTEFLRGRAGSRPAFSMTATLYLESRITSTHQARVGVRVDSVRGETRGIVVNNVGYLFHVGCLCFWLIPVCLSQLKGFQNVEKITGKKQAHFPLGPHWPPVTVSKNSTVVRGAFSLTCDHGESKKI